MSVSTCPLTELEVGDKAIIQAFKDAHSPDGHKLMALGITPGTEIEVTRRAPFSDPIIIRLRGFKLALRKADLKGILVQPVHEK
ncbi:MAG: FeoA family protein [Cellvibrionales bacterium]|nr:FeoA family protein [Cellvibrionales bacterium]